MGVAAKGTLLKRGGTLSTDAYVSVGRVVSIGGPNTSQEALDVTHMESADGYKEFIGGLRDGGEIALEINYDPQNSTHQNLQSDIDTGTLRYWRVVFPTTIAVTAQFQALVTAFSRTAEVASKLTASVTLKISGKPVFS